MKLWSLKIGATTCTFLSLFQYSVSLSNQSKSYHHSAAKEISIQSRRSAVASIFLGTSTAALLKPADEATASTSIEDIKKIYDEGASSYENLYSDSLVSRALDFTTLRKELLSKADGDVLELGVGTGLNLPYYPNGVTSYVGVDISVNMQKQAEARFRESNDSISTVSSSLSQLYKEDKVDFKIGDVNNLSSLFSSPSVKFDTIVDTFGLCVFPEPVKALSSAREMLRPGGKLLLLEHQDSVIGKALSPSRKIADVANTCRYDDDVLQILREAGFRSVESKNVAGGFLTKIVASP